ncbi:MAG: arginase [Deltaproteobacteria bacterium]|nr:arginase [Deltaproteobacteria bacterium]
MPSPFPRRPLHLVGAPLEVGGSQLGTVMGPAGLRTAGLEATLESLGHQVVDSGDLTPIPSAAESSDLEKVGRNASAIQPWLLELSESGYRSLVSGHLPIFLGGDHSLSMGTVNGAARYCATTNRELFVLWLDAHADFNTPSTSPSGNLHGMPLAMLCGEPGFEPLCSEDGSAVKSGVLDPKNLHLFGIRSVDEGERSLLEERGVETTDMRCLDEQGVALPLSRWLEHIRRRGGALHVSLDVDFLDPGLAPGSGTLVPGGASYREAHLVMEMLHDSGLLLSLDVAELNPYLDVRGQSARVLVDLVASLFGRRITHRSPSRVNVA